jgi:predicted AAA+ superfamily ATPase
LNKFYLNYFYPKKVPFGDTVPLQRGELDQLQPQRQQFVSLPANERLLADLVVTHSCADLCLLGAKGAGKSTLVREFSHRLGYGQPETVILYQANNFFIELGN